ncbi:MAG TPA: hypothetical protein VFW50_12035 [Streptosporangiaceae bacterium]|nr:hypothetical protein [Streptosporangiaceae bacterium]
MNLDPVRYIADAVLYEGYILYPYRASSQKNQSRWQFGVVMAPGYAAAEESETSVTQTECVLEHTGQPSVTVLLRFLQVQRRTAQDGTAWDEAVEREVEVTADAAALSGAGVVHAFDVEGGEDRSDGVVRRREPLAGAITVRAAEVPGPWRAVRLHVQVENRTGLDDTPRSRDAALPTALVAAHTILVVTGGDFISMTDPPEWAAPAVAQCRNEGGWPVLADPDGGRKVMLSSPIILYDYPELAAESPGELYDGTEIDEILTLRTLALSDAEKAEARATDPRAAALLDRVESMDAQTMAQLHGTIRSLRPMAGRPAAGQPDPLAPWKTSTVDAGPVDAGPAGFGPVPMPDAPWWDPEADALVSPETDTVTIGGREVSRGSRVVLRPGARRADAQDMFLAGRLAEVQAVLHDVDDTPYLAVSLADEPDEDIRIAHGRFLYFMPDEVEPCS